MYLLNIILLQIYCWVCQ